MRALMIWMALMAPSLAADTGAKLLEERTELDGERTAESVHDALSGALEEIGSCGRDAGEVAVSFEVDDEGHVERARVEGGTVPDPTARKCVQARLDDVELEPGAPALVRVVIQLPS